jgi:replicative DNA helicase
MEKVEFLILRNLLHNEEYLRKVVPFLKSEYFEDEKQKIVYQEIASFVEEYNELTTKEVLCIEIEKRKDITDSMFKDITSLIDELDNSPADLQWLLDTTEKWCRDRAIYLALIESISLADGKDDTKGRDAIPSILSDALAVSFDNHVGHDYLIDYEERYESYHRKEDKIPFDLEFFDKVTKGGLPNKTLNIALAGTGVGKSLFMCHFASSVLLQGKNVLYITMEMAEEKIAERIDANLLNINMQDITDLPMQMFESKVNDISKKTQGTLIIKEYPTAAAHSGHFKGLLNELALKKSFRPDIIFIDYLNICASSRYRAASNVNSYSYIKAIAEELRGLAVEANLPIVSATQTTRSGFASSDVDLTDTSESFGLPATADLMFALISTEELETLNQILVKQLKNRYNDPTIHKRFVVGIDRAKMRLYDCEQKAQEDIIDNTEQIEYDDGKSKFKKTFGDFKF